MKSSDGQRTTAEELLYIHARLGLPSRLRSAEALVQVLADAEERWLEQVRFKQDPEAFFERLRQGWPGSFYALLLALAPKVEAGAS